MIDLFNSVKLNYQKKNKMKMKRKVMMTPTVREIITIFLLVKIIGVAGKYPTVF